MRSRKAGSTGATRRPADEGDRSISAWQSILDWFARLFGKLALRREPEFRSADDLRVLEPRGNPAFSPDIGIGGAVGRESDLRPLSVDAGSGPPTDRRILRLRRAAVVDIFDQLGLDIIPGQVWAFVDGSDNVAIGLDRFFGALGVRSGGLRDRDPAELERANEVLELLVDVADAFERLPETVRSEVARRLASGDYEAVRETAKAVSALERITRLARAWPEDHRLGLFNAFLDQLRFALDDPLDLSAEDVSHAEAAAAAISALMVRFEELRIAYARICADLRSDWPADWSTGAQVDRFDKDAAFFESLAGMLHTDRDTDFASVEGALDELAAAVARLGELHAEALAWIHSAHRSAGAGAGGGAKGSRGAGSSAPPSLREQALEFFGFSRSAHPKVGEIRARWIAFLRSHHPDLGPPAEYDQRTRLSQEASKWKDILCGV